jgi:multiple antibiotic resistance protein
MDPIGVSATMLGMLSRQVTRSKVRILVRQTTWTVVVAFWIVLLAGDTILRLFGIDEHFRDLGRRDRVTSKMV